MQSLLKLLLLPLPFVCGCRDRGRFSMGSTPYSLRVGGGGVVVLLLFTLIDGSTIEICLFVKLIFCPHVCLSVE